MINTHPLIFDDLLASDEDLEQRRRRLELIKIIGAYWMATNDGKNSGEALETWLMVLEEDFLKLYCAENDENQKALLPQKQSLQNLKDKHRPGSGLLQCPRPSERLQ